MGVWLALSTKEMEKAWLGIWAKEESGNAINKRKVEALQPMERSSFVMVI